MQISSSSKLVISLFCLIVLMTFMSLGVWQLNRANEKEAQFNEMQSLSSTQAINVNNNLPTQIANPHVEKGSANSLRAFLPVLAEGRYLEEQQFLLDNIIYKGKPGYYVISPFRLKDSDEVLLVNRGWLEKTDALPVLPDISINSNSTDFSSQIIEGVLANPRSKPVIGGDLPTPVSPTPPLWFYMDLEYFKKQTELNVLPLVLRLNPETNSRFVRDWPKYKAKTGMHIGYAIQWFVFALFVLIAWIGIIYKSRANSKN